MPGMMQGSGVGNITGAEDDKGSVREHLHPSTDAGQALIVAGVGMAILLFTIGRPAKGLGKAVVIGQWILVVGAASAVAHYAARTWTMLHPDAPGAVGVFFDF